MSYEVLEIERHDGIAHLWLANPKRRNAMGPAFWQELPQAVAELDGDPAVRVIVLAARGEHFTVGLDLKSMGSGFVGEDGGGVERQKRLLAEIERLQRSITSLERASKPVIAAIHGYCLGGGIDLITACDIRVAAANAIFSVRETRMAMVADVGTLQRLPRIVGRGRAAELALTGMDIDAARAEAIGLVNSVHPTPAAAFEAAEVMAKRIARCSPLAVQGTKRVLLYSEGKSVEDGLAFVAAWNAAFLPSHDLREAIRAFLEKREPRFEGR